jgi:uncharacterized membrane protein HdeD (DUF308 family)
MLERLSRNWWLVALRGILAVMFGAAALVWPGMTVVFLVLLFGAYAFVVGVTTFGLGCSRRASMRSGGHWCSAASSASPLAW